MLSKKISISICLILLLLISAPQVIAQTRVGVTPQNQFIIHENPSNVTLWTNPDVNYKMEVQLQKMFIDAYYLSIALNESDFQTSKDYYTELYGNYRDYKDMLHFFNVTDDQYKMLDLSADFTVKDIKNILDNSENYSITYQNYNRYLSEGNKVEASKSALELRRAYLSINASKNALKSNASILINTINDSNFLTLPMEEALVNLDSHFYRIEDKQKSVDALLSNTNLTLETGTTEISLGGNTTFTSSLTGENGQPISNTPVSYYINGRPAGEAITDSNGTYQFTYNVTQSSTRHVDVYVEYIPVDRSTVPGFSRTVVIEVQPENTTINLTIEPDSASYGDTVQMAGRITTTRGLAVPGRSINFYLGDQRIGSITSNSDGTYSYAYIIRDTTPGGTSEIHAAFEPSKSADDVFLPSVSNNETIEVKQQATNLVLTPPGSRFIAEDEMPLTGRLTTADGVPVSNVNITILLDDKELATSTTSYDGRYSTIATVPQDLQPGDYCIYSIYTPASSSLTNSASDKVSATFNKTTPLLFVNSMPAVLFAGDTLDINGTIKTINSQPVPDKELIVTTQQGQLGRVISEKNGSYVLSHRVGYNDTLAVYEVSVAAESGGLLSGSNVKAGKVVVVPYDRAPILLLIVLCGLVAIIGVARATGYDRKVASSIRHMIKIPREKEPIIIEETVDLPQEETPVAISVIDIDRELSSLRSSMALENFKEAMIHIYLAVRKISASRGVPVPDSLTHREFYYQVAANYPSLAWQLKTIVDHYEAISFAGGNVGEREVLEAIDSLSETEKMMIKDNNHEDQ